MTVTVAVNGARFGFNTKNARAAPAIVMVRFLEEFASRVTATRPMRIVARVIARLLAFIRPVTTAVTVAVSRHEAAAHVKCTSKPF